MAAQQIDPNAVIARLSAQIGALSTEVAMRDVALESMQAEFDALLADATEHLKETP